MSFVEKNSILDFFNKLNSSGLDYILIRNINDELPGSLKIKKDIDLLVKFSERKKILNFMFQNGFKKITHPHVYNIFLYGVHKFEKVINKANVLIDLNYCLTCRSSNKGEWIPLDQVIQKSAWENKRFINFTDDFAFWSLSYEDEFITLVVRSVFDWREFQSGYVKRIIKLYNLIDKDDVLSKFELVFFRYSDTLMKEIKNENFKSIIPNYISFKDY